MKYINFNNAGSSRPYEGVNKAIKQFLETEEKFGGYYAADKFKKKIDSFYCNLSKLINCEKNEISFLSSTTLAWNLFFNSIKLTDKQNVIIFENEYGSNLIYYIQKGINIRIVKIKEDGKVCFEDLKKKIDKNTKIVCLCHIASQCGDIIEAEKIGKILYKINPKILYVVDACQSIGHINVDVSKINCDVLVGSGRKYLRGPRGTGFIFLNNKIRSKIKPLILDLNNSKLYEKRVKVKNARIFENFEYSPALKIGLSKAIEKLNNIGIERLELDIKKKSLFFRKKIENFKKICLFENKNCISGINTFRVKGMESNKLYDYLLSKKILCSVPYYDTSRIYFKKKKITNLLRISIHHYNTKDEINYLVKCLIDLIKK